MQVEQTQGVIREFCEFYRSLQYENLDKLELIYAQNAKFVDPLHEVNGLPAISAYFQKIMQQGATYYFEIHQVTCENDQAWLSWTMRFSTD